MMVDGPDAWSAALRAVSFALLLNAAGVPIFIAAFGRLMPNSLPDVRSLGRKLAIAALVVVIAHQALEAARMAGEMGGVADLAMQKMALLSPAGAAFAARLLGLALIALGLSGFAPAPRDLTPAPTGSEMSSTSTPSAASPTVARPRGLPALSDMRANSASRDEATQPSAAPPVPVAALLGSLLTAASFALVGHTSTASPRVIAAALITLHMLVAAFWIGSLWPLYIAAEKEAAPITAQVIEAFSAIASWLIPLILLAGVGLSVMLLPSLETLRQPYGQLLLAKVSGFAVLLALASLNKWQYGPACAEGNTDGFKKTIVIEYVLICAVLTATAIMTMFFSPEVA